MYTILTKKSCTLNYIIHQLHRVWQVRAQSILNARGPGVHWAGESAAAARRFVQSSSFLENAGAVGVNVSCELFPRLVLGCIGADLCK